MRRGFGSLLAGIALSALCWSCDALAQTIVVGGKAFTEQQIMTAMTGALLQAKGFTPLAKAVNGGAKLTFASNAEFYARPDGLPGWQKAYGFEFDRDNVKRMDTGLTYSALKDRQVDTAVVFATDGRIPAFNFVVLKDDKHYAAPYNLTPVVRKEILDKNPKIGDALPARPDRRRRGRDADARIGNRALVCRFATLRARRNGTHPVRWQAVWHCRRGVCGCYHHRCDRWPRRPRTYQRTRGRRNPSGVARTLRRRRPASCHRRA